MTAPDRTGRAGPTGEAGLDRTARADLDRLTPGARSLVRCAALAVRLQPEVVRALRVGCLPRLDAGVEAELWWSDVVVTRDTDAVTLSAPALRLLRAELRELHRTTPEVTLRARDIVHSYHRHEPPAFVVEEELVWAAVRDDAETADAELGRVLDALVDAGRTTLGDWWAAAWGRLPDLARRTPNAQRLSIATGERLGPDAVVDPATTGDVVDAVLGAALRSVADVPLGVVRRAGVLAIGDVGPAAAAAIAVPDTRSRLLQLRWQVDGAERSETLRVGSGTVTRTVGDGPVSLRTERGYVYEIPPDTSRILTPPRSTVQPWLGAHYDGAGTSFTVFSSTATAVTLCLFDHDGAEQQAAMVLGAGGLWQGYLAGVGPGQRYGYRVDGEWDPSRGRRSNPAKLLVDPYAYAIDGRFDPHGPVYGHRADDPDARDDADSAPFVPRSVVVDPAFDWGSDRSPRRSYADTVIYEAHVKGMTQTHPRVPEPLRGTYAGMAHPAVVEHLVSLGVTALELMPVHHFVDTPSLAELGLTDYWGYNTIGFFAPDARYCSTGRAGDQVTEFKAMVRTLHAAGIEVILDVVYNHTAEGNHLGPTVSMRGLDNAAYYRLVDNDQRYYMDYTGTGNTFNVRHARSLQLIMDSLRHWVLEMHVDGFRFDLASSLAREFYDVDRLSTFFDLIQQDPVIGQVKLIAEPWDIGPGGYQVGRFPALWSEWNGRYRDTVRDLWRGEPGTLGEFAARLSGSADLYEASGRRPFASVNFVTSHDGFTLRDLVSYNEHHNEANGEGNNDGESHNRSWNCGVEGETKDPEVRRLRGRQQRNLLTTLLLSQGVPMICHGDELGRTQGGNNNAWTQDNATTWIDWGAVDVDLLEFTRRLVALRTAHPVFRRRRFFDGRPTAFGEARPDIAWFAADGAAMTDDSWESGPAAIGLYLNGDAIPGTDARGERLLDDSFLLWFNGGPGPLEFVLPHAGFAAGWVTVIDTSLDPAFVVDRTRLSPSVLRAGSSSTLPGFATAVLQAVD